MWYGDNWNSSTSMLIAGGDFSVAGSVIVGVKGIAAWNGKNWLALGRIFFFFGWGFYLTLFIG
jgi:hypothetical protein